LFAEFRNRFSAWKVAPRIGGVRPPYCGLSITLVNICINVRAITLALLVVVWSKEKRGARVSLSSHGRNLSEGARQSQRQLR
jgi:hypothetical protein